MGPDLRSETTNALAVVSFEETPLLEITHHAADDESRRPRGRARVLVNGEEAERALQLLRVKYERIIATARRPAGSRAMSAGRSVTEVHGEHWRAGAVVPILLIHHSRVQSSS